MGAEVEPPLACAVLMAQNALAGCDAAFAGRIGISWVSTAVAALPPDACPLLRAQVASSPALPSETWPVVWREVHADVTSSSVWGFR